ncbi:MAG: 3-isopropylmalate dehydratase large subunit [Treponema bryantii]|nr:3-isopropylmalate dehydratase large subunit [Treponema bryantii]
MGRTIAQKIFDSHIIDKPFENTFVISLDNVFCHEITTPIAINDLVLRNKDKVFDSTKIKAVIDHVTPAKDSKTATQGKILRDWATRNNIKDFFDIGKNGVCHALFPEKGFVRPGQTIIMGDSHTCTYGAFGTFAAGVGTTDLEVGILKGVCAFREPKSIKITLDGKLKKGVFAKDVILFLIAQLGVNGATDCVIEFTGPIISAMNMEERMTLCNMVVEAGATSGICNPDMNTVEYLWPFIKNDFATKQDALTEYSKFSSDKDAIYEKELYFDLSTLTPLCTFGYKPDQVKTVKEMEGTSINQVYIGSCTNGRISDLRIAAQILKGKTIAPNVRGIVSPATVQTYKIALQEGLIDIFIDAGFCVTNPTCGACLGMSNGVLAEGEVCASTTNRNFNGRMGKGGMIHLMSPATAAASSIMGYITNSELFIE